MEWWHLSVRAAQGRQRRYDDREWQVVVRAIKRRHEELLRRVGEVRHHRRRIPSSGEDRGSRKTIIKFID